MCSPDDRHNSSVHFHSDAAYLVINTVFGLSNGYLTNICLMATPKEPCRYIDTDCEPHKMKNYSSTNESSVFIAVDAAGRQMVDEARHQSVAASLSVFSLVGGLLVGSAMSRLWIKLL